MDGAVQFVRSSYDLTRSGLSGFTSARWPHEGLRKGCALLLPEDRIGLFDPNNRIVHMARRRTPSAVGVTGLDRLDNSLMLFAHGPSEVFASSLIRPCDTRGTLEQAAQIVQSVQQEGIARGVGDAPVESDVLHHPVAAGLDCCVDGSDAPVDAFEVVPGAPFGSKSRHLGLERTSYFGHLHHRFLRHCTLHVKRKRWNASIANVYTAALPRFDKTQGLESRYGFPYDGAADSKLR